MLAELGQLCMLIALGLALVQGLAAGAGRDRAAGMLALARPAAGAQLLFALIAFVLLAHAFITHDYSLRYVATNSNLLLPLFYRIAAVWGGHEGSLLLWALLGAAWGAALAWRSGGLPPALLARALGVLGLVNAGFLLFMILTSNPFARLAVPAADGSDLNPLLQDPGLVFHPPLLYAGYVGFAVAFACSVAALIEGRTDHAWLRALRPWAASAWVFLTLGITLGSWWAYNELGWGGWWFWDPVENASFMPWLAGTALLHCLAVAARRGLFLSWCVLLSILAFALSLLGTFLVRSGVLSSVHAFASDPGRGLFILLLLALATGSALALYAWRAPALLAAGKNFAANSRETYLLLNSVLLTAAVFAVLLGTLYPLALEVFTSERISVGPPYFELSMLVLVLPATLAAGLALLTGWGRDTAARVLRAAWIPLLGSVVVGAVLPMVLFGRWDLGAAAGTALAAWLLITAAGSWLRQRRSGGRVSTQAGMALAHLGVAIFIIGLSYIEAYGVSRDVSLQPGETVSVAEHDFVLREVAADAGPNYQALRAYIDIQAPNGRSFELRPEKRFYYSQESPLTEAAIDITPFRDLYISLGSEIDGGGWSARIQLKPFVRWLWTGAVLMALGGALAAWAAARPRRTAQAES